MTTTPPQAPPPVVRSPPEIRRGWAARITFHDGQSRPDRVQQLVLGDDLAGPLKELDQHLHRLQFELDGAPVDAQFEPGFIELAAANTPDAPGGRRHSRS